MQYGQVTLHRNNAVYIRLDIRSTMNVDYVSAGLLKMRILPSLEHQHSHYPLFLHPFTPGIELTCSTNLFLSRLLATHRTEYHLRGLSDFRISFTNRFLFLVLFRPFSASANTRGLNGLLYSL